MFRKTFRLFVSSTFRDFAEERRLLQETVFPELEDYCSAHGYGFRAVDMRWGVNAEAQLDQRTAEICLDEVRAAAGYPAPNLLILIGDRYGWIPLPFAIAENEFEAARDWLHEQGDHELVAQLDRVYRRDENHVAGDLRAASGSHDAIAAYTLRARDGDIADLASAEAWSQAEGRLREALQRAAHHLRHIGRLDDREQQKYSLSLTEQEIREGLEAARAGENAIAWIRTTPAGEAQAQTLAAAIKQVLPKDNVIVSNWRSKDRSSKRYRNAFVSTLTAKLKAAVDRHISASEAQTQAPDFALRTERAAHSAFASERSLVFIGRESNLAAIAAYVANDAQHPLVLTGASGSGKSALMAQAAAGAALGSRVIQRFVGASAASSNQRSLLMSVLEDLAALGVIQRPEAWEDDDERFVGQVRGLIGAIVEPVVIFIDALDQIRPPYRPAWLPDTLKAGVKLIVSVLDDASFGSERAIVMALRNRLPSKAFVDIEPLNASEGADILKGLEREARRALQPRQRAFIIDRFLAAGASPLYLVVAFAIARRWRSTVDPGEHGLADTLTSLIAQFIDELSSVHHHEPLLVRRALGLLSASKDGLSESELIAVLSRDEEVMQAVSSVQLGAHAARLPDSIWVRLRRSLSAMLVEKGSDGEPLLNFFHRQVADVARTQSYEPERVALHRRLAAYFDDPANSADNKRAVPGRRGLSELPYQLFHGQMRARLDELLADPTWIGRKIEAFFGVAEIVEDYELFADPSQKMQPLIGRSLRLASGIIARDPRQALVQLHGRLIGAGDAGDAPFMRVLRNALAENSLVETVPALTPPGPELARLEGHAGKVMALVALPDGRLVSGAADKTIRLWDPGSGLEVMRVVGDDSEYGVIALSLLGDGRLVSGGNDGVVRLWDIARVRETARLEGHRAPVQAFAELSDRRLASAAHNGEIRIWSTDSGRELTRLADGGRPVLTLAVLPDGRLASGGVYGGIHIWDTATGATSDGFKGHQDDVLALLVLPQARLASGGSSGAIRLWDIESGREVACLKGHRGSVNALAALPDGRMVSGAQDGIIVWDLEKLQQVERLESPLGWVRALAVLPDGRLASGTQGGARLNEGSVSLWDLTRKPVRIPGHGKSVLSLAVLTEGRLASGGDDGAIVYWDAQSGRELNRVEAGALGIAALAPLPDGRLASGEANISSLIRLWDPQTGGLLDQFIAEGAVRALAALPDGRLFSCVARLRDEYVLWDLHVANKLEASRQIASFKYIGKALAVLPNGQLAGGAEDSSIRLWSPASGRELAALRGHSGRVNALAALSNERLASGSDDLTIRLWDLRSGRAVAKLAGHTGPINAVAALPDGGLASASDDRTIRLWDLASLREVARLELDGKVLALAALPHGRLVAGDQLGRLHWLAIEGARAPNSARHASTRKPRAALRRNADAGAPPRPPTAVAWFAWVLGFMILSAAAFLAAAAFGPKFGFDPAHDALTRWLSTIDQR